jgi:predicted lysophospholipase L1 biosynthesis ABC-type transport system permease subunit
VAQARRLVSSQDEEAMGGDVVVRHFSRPVTAQKAKQTPQQAGLKHFSDMDN